MDTGGTAAPLAVCPLVTGGTAAPLAVCPLPSRNPGGTANVGPLEGGVDVAEGPVCELAEVQTLPPQILPGKDVAGAKLKPGFVC